MRTVQMAMRRSEKDAKNVLGDMCIHLWSFLIWNLHNSVKALFIMQLHKRRFALDESLYTRVVLLVIAAYIEQQIRARDSALLYSEVRREVRQTMQSKIFEKFACSEYELQTLQQQLRKFITQK